MEHGVDHIFDGRGSVLHEAGLDQHGQTVDERPAPGGARRGVRNGRPLAATLRARSAWVADLAAASAGSAFRAVAEHKPVQGGVAQGQVDVGDRLLLQRSSGRCRRRLQGSP